MPNKPTALITRLRDLMASRQLNARELATLAGVGPSFIYDILRGKSANPTLHKLSSVARVLGVPVDYLLEGGTLPESDDNERIVQVPVIALESSFGSEMLVHDLDAQPAFFTYRWLKDDMEVNPAHAKVVHMPDDSMAPALSQGDMLLVDTSDTQPKQTGTYLVFEGEALTVRSLKQEGETLSTSCYNNDYSVPDAAQILVMGRVVWIARSL